jgi:aminoglycoside 3-N-acetyltransferase
MGEGSPLARLYDLDGWVLLLGISHGNNTSFHLGEVRSGVRKHVVQGAPVYRDDLRVWQTYDDIEYDDEHFPEIGAEFDCSGQVKVGRVGLGEARLFCQRPAVDFACQWLKEHSMEG